MNSFLVVSSFFAMILTPCFVALRVMLQEDFTPSPIADPFDR